MSAPRLPAHAGVLAAQRFCPMNVPACEVAVATGLESHALRARVVMLWRIAIGRSAWTPRAAELLHEGTLDSTCEAFDPYHAPFSRIFLDARADLWEAGLAPPGVRSALERHEPVAAPPVQGRGPQLLVAGEAAYAGAATKDAEGALAGHGVQASVLAHGGGALAWLLGARDRAAAALAALIARVAEARPERVVADGPQTEWWLRRGPGLTGVTWPAGLDIAPLADALGTAARPTRELAGPVFVHDSRASYWLAGVQPDGRCVMPGWQARADAQERACGDAPLYERTRHLVERAAPAGRVWSVWSRALAASCGSDDGLWAAAPDLAARLARARLAHARGLGARAVVTDSPLAATWLARHAGTGDPAVHTLASLFASGVAR